MFSLWNCVKKWMKNLIIYRVDITNPSYWLLILFDNNFWVTMDLKIHFVHTVHICWSIFAAFYERKYLNFLNIINKLISLTKFNHWIGAEGVQWMNFPQLRHCHYPVQFISVQFSSMCVIIRKHDATLCVITIVKYRAAQS